VDRTVDGQQARPRAVKECQSCSMFLCKNKATHSPYDDQCPWFQSFFLAFSFQLFYHVHLIISIVDLVIHQLIHLSPITVIAHVTACWSPFFDLRSPWVQHPCFQPLWSNISINQLWSASQSLIATLQNVRVSIHYE
jgi:hypothetical protein